MNERTVRTVEYRLDIYKRLRVVLLIGFLCVRLKKSHIRCQEDGHTVGGKGLLMDWNSVTRIAARRLNSLLCNLQGFSHRGREILVLLA